LEHPCVLADGAALAALAALVGSRRAAFRARETCDRTPAGSAV